MTWPRAEKTRFSIGSDDSNLATNILWLVGHLEANLPGELANFTCSQQNHTYKLARKRLQAGSGVLLHKIFGFEFLPVVREAFCLIRRASRELDIEIEKATQHTRSAVPFPGRFCEKKNCKLADESRNLGSEFAMPLHAASEALL